MAVWLDERLLASDSLDRTDAIAAAEEWLSSFQVSAGAAVQGFIASIEDCGAVIETPYFDGPGGSVKILCKRVLAIV